VRGVLAAAVTLAAALAWLAGPNASASATPSAAAAILSAAAGARPLQPATQIAVNTADGSRVYDGVGAILGGGGNARYLMDYPATQRDQILDYLFKPGYGASLQILKLEIGGDANSSDGSEPSIEHTAGHVNCHAGYELSIAQRAVALNPHLRLYGLQWAGPGLVKTSAEPNFTTADIRYLLNWLGCARRRGLTISYLGGWNETDDGTHAAWFRQLRSALNAHGDRGVQLVAADSGPAADWPYTGDPVIPVLGTHDVCGFPTGVAGPATRCTSPWSAGHPTSQAMWASELGAMDAGAQPGCTQPCAPAMDRAVIRGYVDARLTGFLEWPALDAMPGGLPYENRGLVTADQPWAGSYQVNAMTWAIAQLTQFARPPDGSVRWRYINQGSGFLQGRRADGSYVSLVRDSGKRRTAWSTIIEATTATAAQRAVFRVTGSARLAGRTVHVWASDFAIGAGSRPARWFTRQRSIRPSGTGQFGLTIQPGWVYSLTTTSGQGHGRARGRAGAPLGLPVTESLASSGAAGSADDEPPYLAAQDGAFELARCRVPDRGDRTCTKQEAVATPAFWHDHGSAAATHYPYAVIGDLGWQNYAVSVDVLLPGSTSSAGLIGRFSCQHSVPGTGQFDGYVLSVSGAGRWRLTRNANSAQSQVSAGCPSAPARPAAPQVLASGQLAQPLGTGTWHRLTLSMSGSAITASVGGTRVATVSDPTWTSGLAGIAAGPFGTGWPQVEYSHLSVTRA
jgi:Glycosyl hydrolase family 59